jgi:hypothetical protein
VGWEASEEVQKFTLLSAFFAKRPVKSLFSVVSSSFSCLIFPKQASFIKMAEEPRNSNIYTRVRPESTVIIWPVMLSLRASMT